MTGIRDLFTGEPALVPAALRGYRTWRILDLNGRLISTGIVNHRWRPAPYGGTSEQAKCLAGWDVLDSPSHAPAADCTCGLYGWYAPDDSRIPLAGCTGPIFGVVQATGRVILGTHGFRAEKLEVLAVTCASPAVRERLREFGYPVHDNREDMLAAFPPEDLTTRLRCLLPVLRAGARSDMPERDSCRPNTPCMTCRLARAVLTPKEKR